jgi:HK97 family phage major capsid protein
MFRLQSGGLDKAGFNSLDDFLTSLTLRLKDERLDRRTFLAKDGPSGGYSVPEYWAASIFDQGLESEIVRPRATIYPMESETLKIPAWDSMNHTNGTMFGGFTIAYLGENQDATPVTGALRQVNLTSHKVGIYTEISREAQTSGISLELQLKTKLTQAVSFLLDRDFLTGDGVAKPLGALNSPSKITVVRATANQVNYADVYGMYGRLAPQCQNNAVWVASHSVLPQLLNMQVGGELVFVYGIATATPLTLFGRPILFTEKTSALGAAGDLMLVDFSQYAIGLRQEIQIDVSNAPGWTRDVTSLRCILRTDGLSLWQDPITPLNGGDTLSWCVVLQ